MTRQNTQRIAEELKRMATFSPKTDKLANDESLMV
jgi:hypothetical protein